MADRSGPDPQTRRLLERARVVVFGHLAPMILHETNNVLTVMAGVRQLLKSNTPLSDRIGSMIDEQLARMEDLVGSIRRIGPEETAGEKARKGLEGIVDALEPVLRLAGKGRGVAIERGEIAAATPQSRETLLLATLALLLPLLPPRGGGGAARVEIRAAVADGRATLHLRVSPSRSALADDERALVRDLLEASGGSLRETPGAAAFEAAIVVPAKGA